MQNYHVLALNFINYLGCLVSHGQASLNLLSCLDTLCQLPDVNLTSNEDETTKSVTQKSHSKEDYSVVNRLDNFCVFKCNNNITLNPF